MAWGNTYGMNPYAQMAMQQYQQNMQMQQPQPQAQSNAIIHVPSEEVARRWDVAPNSSVTFIDDSKPYCYTKSMGMSMLEAPVFKRFKLVEETEPVPTSDGQTVSDQQTPMPQVDLSAYMTKAEFESYRAIIEDMQKIVKELNGDE
jgi:hypothetical protein